MKTLLINSPQIYNYGEEPIISFPLGLGYIAGMLSKEKVPFSVLDNIGGAGVSKNKSDDVKYYWGYPRVELKQKIRRLNPDVILLNLSFTNQVKIIKEISKDIKDINPEIIIIIGGHQATAMPEIVLKETCVDFVILGEAEYVLLELLKKIHNKGDPFDISCIGYKTDGKIIIDSSKGIVENLDKLPFPEWDRFYIDNYLQAKRKHATSVYGNRVIEVITTRGCPNGCSYCASHIICGKKMRNRSVDSVIGEIKTLVEEYGVDEIHFVDDNLTFDLERFKEICIRLIPLKIKWTAPNGIQISKISDDLIDLMIKSGCYSVYLPIETANQKILETYINKQIDFKRIKSLIKTIRDRKITIYAFFIIGFDIESKKDIIKTIRYASKLGIDEAIFSIVTPLPGSDYFEKLVMEHMININNSSIESFSAKNANFGTQFLTKNEVEKLRNQAYLHFEIHKFFNNPFRYFSVENITRLWRYFRYLAQHEIKKSLWKFYT